MNLTQRLLVAGFRNPDPDQKVNSMDGWLGVNAFHPDLVLERGNKRVEISLQGSLFAFRSPFPLPEVVRHLAQRRAVRYIGFFEDGKSVAESYSGGLPADWIIEKFLA